jgi:formyltetrahydrofolate hydrolase
VQIRTQGTRERPTIILRKLIFPHVGEAERIHKTYNATPRKEEKKYFLVDMFCILCTKYEVKVMTFYQSITMFHLQKYSGDFDPVCYGRKVNLIVLVTLVKYNHCLHEVETRIYQVGFEVLIAVVMESSIFWDITSCSP